MVIAYYKRCLAKLDIFFFDYFKLKSGKYKIVNVKIIPIIFC